MTTKVRSGGIANDAIHNIHLSDDSVDSDVVSNNILSKVNVAGTSVNDPSQYRLGKVYTGHITSTFTRTSNTLADAFTTGEYSGFTGGSDIEFYMYVPTRNDSTDWGGAYIEPNLSFDNGTTYYSLGSSGYDGGVMGKSLLIHNYTKSYWIKNSTSNIPSSGTFGVRFKLRFCPYTDSSTLYINGSHDVNGKTGTYNFIDNGIETGYNRYQHYCHWIIKEWIPV